MWDLEKGLPFFKENFFEAILAKDILEHLQKPWQILSELYKALKPGGIIIASVPMAKARVVWNDYTHIRGYTKKALRAIFGDSGFQVIYIKKMGGIPGAGRLHLVKYIPLFLKIPVLDFLFGKSFEIKARKPKNG